MVAQAQKHVTHNEAIRALDAIVQIGVGDRDLAAPPVSPTDGDRYSAGYSGDEDAGPGLSSLRRCQWTHVGGV